MTTKLSVNVLKNTLCSISKHDNLNQIYDLTFRKLTKGELLSIKNALNVHSGVSMVAEDLLGYLNDALVSCDEEWLKDI